MAASFLISYYMPKTPSKRIEQSQGRKNMSKKVLVITGIAVLASFAIGGYIKKTLAGDHLW